VSTENLQDRIPDWAAAEWEAGTAKLEAVGLTKLRPGFRQVTKILLAGGAQITTPTTTQTVDERIWDAERQEPAEDYFEVDSLDFEDQSVRVKRDQVLAYFAAVHDDTIPTHRPVQQVVEQMPGNGLDLTQLGGRPRR